MEAPNNRRCSICGGPLGDERIRVCKDCQLKNMKRMLKGIAKQCLETQACHNCNLCGDDGKSCLIDGHPFEWGILEEDE